MDLINSVSETEREREEERRRRQRPSTSSDESVDVLPNGAVEVFFSFFQGDFLRDL